MYIVNYFTSKNKLDLSNKNDLRKAEQILGLTEGRLTNTSTIVMTEVNIKNLNSRLPENGNEFFVLVDLQVEE